MGVFHGVQFLYLLARRRIMLYFVPVINGIFDLHAMGCGEMELNYTVVRSKKRKKTISLQVKANGTAIIYAPDRTPLPEIEKFVREKKGWLWRKITEHGERQKEIKTKKYATGETFLFLSESYPLKIEDVAEGCDKLALLYGEFVLASDKVSQGRELFIDWYRKEAERYIGERVESFQPSPQAHSRTRQDKQCALPLGFVFSKESSSFQLAARNGNEFRHRLRGCA